MLGATSEAELCALLEAMSPELWPYDAERDRPRLSLGLPSQAADLCYQLYDNGGLYHRLRLHLPEIETIDILQRCLDSTGWPRYCTSAPGVAAYLWRKVQRNGPSRTPSTVPIARANDDFDWGNFTGVLMPVEAAVVRSDTAIPTICASESVAATDAQVVVRNCAYNDVRLEDAPSTPRRVLPSAPQEPPPAPPDSETPPQPLVAFGAPSPPPPLVRVTGWHRFESVPAVVQPMYALPLATRPVNALALMQTRTAEAYRNFVRELGGIGWATYVQLFRIVSIDESKQIEGSDQPNDWHQVANVAQTLAAPQYLFSTVCQRCQHFVCWTSMEVSMMRLLESHWRKSTPRYAWLCPACTGALPASIRDAAYTSGPMAG